MKRLRLLLFLTLLLAQPLGIATALQGFSSTARASRLAL